MEQQFRDENTTTIKEKRKKGSLVVRANARFSVEDRRRENDNA